MRSIAGRIPTESSCTSLAKAKAPRGARREWVTDPMTGRVKYVEQGSKPSSSPLLRTWKKGRPLLLPESLATRNVPVKIFYTSEITA
jgi:hypothetical protein